MAAEATASTELVTMAEITPSALMETTMVNTEDYNTLIECLKSDIPLTTTQVTLLESVTQQLMKRNCNVQRRLSMTQKIHCSLASLADPLPLPRLRFLVLDCWLH